MKGRPRSEKLRLVCSANARIRRLPTSGARPRSRGRSIHRRSSAAVGSFLFAAASWRLKCVCQVFSRTKYCSPIWPSFSGLATALIAGRSVRSTSTRPSSTRAAFWTSARTFSQSIFLTSRSKWGWSGYWWTRAWPSRCSRAEPRSAPTGVWGVKLRSSERKAGSWVASSVPGWGSRAIP